jgi:hypothetical protein
MSARESNAGSCALQHTCQAAQQATDVPHWASLALDRAVFEHSSREFPSREKEGGFEHLAPTGAQETKPLGEPKTRWLPQALVAEPHIHLSPPRTGSPGDQDAGARCRVACGLLLAVQPEVGLLPSLGLAVPLQKGEKL